MVSGETNGRRTCHTCESKMTHCYLCRASGEFKRSRSQEHLLSNVEFDGSTGSPDRISSRDTGDTVQHNTIREHY